MADPTESEFQTQISHVVAQYIAMKNFGFVTTPNLLSLDNDIVTSQEGDYAPEVLTAQGALRSGYGGLLARTRAILDPLWQTYGKVLKFPETDPATIIARVYDNFVTNSKDVNSREFTFGAVAAGGGNVGGGTVHRLNVDENNFEIENQTADIKTIECIADEHSGAAAEHEERFEIRGEHADRDGIQITGSGDRDTLTAVSARNSLQFMTNPSFTSEPDSLTAPTSISGWTAGSSIGNFAIVEGAANTYRGYQGEGDTARALKIEADDYLKQNLNVKRFTNPSTNSVLSPMYLQMAWNREVGASDALTLTLTLGSQTIVTAVGGAETGWQIARIAVGQKNWFKTWNQEDPEIRITVAGLASGYLLVDDIVFAPYQFFDGGWYMPVGNATPFLKDDSFTFTDSIAADSKIQRTIAELYGLYLPHVDDASETWADPA